MVEVVEVGPRDGLQNDPADLTTEQKIELVRRTVEAGVRRVEVASFVNPQRVPKMADAEAVVAGLAGIDGASWIGLVLNERGFARAAATGGLHEVNLVVVSTDEFSQRNSGMPTAAMVDVVRAVVPLAREAGLVPTVTLAASFGCPFSGEVAVARTVELAAECAEAGVAEVALADTIGVAVPADVEARVGAVRAAVPASVSLRAHFHNTRNTGYANALAALDAGVTALDASLGGIGGCPFAPEATGNIATEDLVWMLERSGVSTGIDLDAMIRASEWLASVRGLPTPGLLAKAGRF
jgi:hydroxymethylglutaryl-CoA lyase